MDSSGNFKKNFRPVFSRILRSLFWSGHTVELACLTNENVATTVDKVFDAKCGICTQRMDTSVSMAVANLSLWPCEFLVVITRQRSLLRYENYRRRFTPSFVASTACISIPWLDFQVQS